MGKLRDLAGALLGESLAAGAVAADVFVKDTASREISLPEGEESRSRERGLALRVFMPDGRSSFTALTLGPGSGRLERKGLDFRLPARAVSAAGYSSPVDLPELPSGAAAGGRGLGLLDPDIESLDEPFLEAADQIQTMAAELTGQGGARLVLHAVSSKIHLANTAGFAGSYRQTMARMGLTLAREMEGHAAHTRIVRASRSLRGLAADNAAAEALSLLDERLSPRIPPAGLYPVLLAPAAAAEIVAALASLLMNPAAGGRPVLIPSARIGADALTLTDDGALPGGIASSPFDGEGSPTRRTVLIRRGVVKERLRDLSTRGGEGGSTGNSVRHSFRDPPSLGPTNLFINPGQNGPADLQGTIREGIRISTLGRIPALTDLDSRFSVPFTGRWIQDGTPGAPLGGGYLAGSLGEVLGDIAAAGSDLYFSHRRGSFGAPSLLLNRAAIRSS